MKSKKCFRNVVLAVALAASLLPGAAALAAPQIQKQGSVSFVSGGIGLTEVDEMKKLAAGFPVELLFVSGSIPPNRWLTEIKVQIKDAAGKLMLDTVSLGPYLLVKLPPGKYSISADSDGTVIRRSIQVRGSKTQHVGFVWNQPVDVCISDRYCN